MTYIGLMVLVHFFSYFASESGIKKKQYDLGQITVHDLLVQLVADFPMISEFQDLLDHKPTEISIIVDNHVLLMPSGLSNIVTPQSDVAIGPIIAGG